MGHGLFASQEKLLGGRSRADGVRATMGFMQGLGL